MSCVDEVVDTTSSISGIDDAIIPLELIRLGDLCVTPYHPIKLNNKTG